MNEVPKGAGNLVTRTHANVIFTALTAHNRICKINMELYGTF